jgi:hypothetical protein
MRYMHVNPLNAIYALWVIGTPTRALAETKRSGGQVGPIYPVNGNRRISSLCSHLEHQRLNGQLLNEF